MVSYCDDNAAEAALAASVNTSATAFVGVAMLRSYLEQTLRQIPTVFGRLAYTTSLWDPAAMCYRYHPLSGHTSPKTVDGVLGKVHLEVFRQWLALNLRQQRGDLIRCLDFDGTVYKCLRSWCDNGLIGQLAPTTARDCERQLFSADFAAVVEALLGGFGL
jgi:hypothetical protein